jgi:hydrogenase expression/formation protein HypE
MDHILLSHGSGGRLTHDLITDLFVKHFNNPSIKELGDSAVLTLPHGRIALTTDSFVIDPLVFPGGDIGKLAVCGTVNDLAVAGARPLYLSAGFIIEEGLPLETLRRVVRSMQRTAREAGVSIVAGDTKVVEKGACDKLFITTSGVGIMRRPLRLSPGRVKPGDKIIVTGSIGDHGIATLVARKRLHFGSTLKSDCAPINRLIEKALAASDRITFMRDPTRGGVAMVLNEIVEGQPFGVELWEENLPVKDAVREISELLGFDPLYIANEGKAVIAVDARDADRVLRALRQERLGKQAAIIGEAQRTTKGKVVLQTRIGGKRIIDMPVGEQLPRIC